MAQNIPGLAEDEAELFFELKRNLDRLQQRNRGLSEFYEAERSARSMGIMIPPEFSTLKHVLNWPADAVDKVVERLGFDGFVEPGASQMNTDLLSVFNDNGMELQQGLANTEAGISGVAFVLTTTDPDQPSGVSIQTYASHEATGRWNHRLKALDAGLVVEDAGLYGFTGSWWMYLPDMTIWVERVGGGYRAEVYANPTGRVMLRPLPFSPRTGKPLGRSLITRPIQAYCEQGVRVTLRTEVQAELFSVPGRAVIGADDNAFVDSRTGEQMSAWEARIGTVLTLGLNQDTLEKPTIQEFQQATMQPHMEHMRMLAALYTDASGVHTSLSSSGVDNPESADAKRESRSVLVSKVEGLQRSTTRPWSLVAGDVLTLLNGGVVPSSASGLMPKWRDASAPTKASQAENVRVLIESGVLPPTSEVTLELLGFDSTTISRLRADQREQQSNTLLTAIAAARGAQLPMAETIVTEAPSADA